MSPRIHIPAAVRQVVARLQHGMDPTTGLVILGSAELDHSHELADGGTNDLDNLVWRNWWTHRDKSAARHRARAKAKRIAKKLAGDRSRFRWPKRSLTHPHLKRKVDGQVVARFIQRPA